MNITWYLILSVLNNVSLYCESLFFINLVVVQQIRIFYDQVGRKGGGGLNLKMLTNFSIEI